MRVRICDVCEQELVPFAGAWICPDALKDLPAGTEEQVNAVRLKELRRRSGGIGGWIGAVPV